MKRKIGPKSYHITNYTNKLYFNDNVKLKNKNQFCI